MYIMCPSSTSDSMRNVLLNCACKQHKQIDICSIKMYTNEPIVIYCIQSVTSPTSILQLFVISDIFIETLGAFVILLERFIFRVQGKYDICRLSERAIKVHLSSGTDSSSQDKKTTSKTHTLPWVIAEFIMSVWDYVYLCAMWNHVLGPILTNLLLLLFLLPVISHSLPQGLLAR